MPLWGLLFGVCPSYAALSSAVPVVTKNQHFNAELTPSVLLLRRPLPGCGYQTTRKFPTWGLLLVPIRCPGYDQREWCMTLL